MKINSCNRSSIPNKKYDIAFESLEKSGEFFENNREIGSQRERATIPNLASRVEQVNTQNSELRRWLTMRQAACYLGLSVRGLEGYVRRGQICCYKPFGKILFDKDELDLVIRSSRK